MRRHTVGYICHAQNAHADLFAGLVASDLHRQRDLGGACIAKNFAADSTVVTTLEEREVTFACGASLGGFVRLPVTFVGFGGLSA